MFSSVKSAFFEFNAPIEGVVKFMYLDVKGLVTVGMGNLIDPVSESLSLSFQHRQNGGGANAGQLASQQEIMDEWKKVKSRTDLSLRGAGAFDAITTLELSDFNIEALVSLKLNKNEGILKSCAEFLNFDSWPADAQMAVLSMAWALGPAFGSNWPKFSKSCQNRDFNQAAEESRISTVGNPGVARRNDANFILLKNAAIVDGDKDKYPGSILYYPRKLF